MRQEAEDFLTSIGLQDLIPEMEQAGAWSVHDVYKYGSHVPPEMARAVGLSASEVEEIIRQGKVRDDEERLRRDQAEREAERAARHARNARNNSQNMDQETRAFLTRLQLGALIPALEEEGITTMDDVRAYNFPDDVAASVGLNAEAVFDVIDDALIELMDEERRQAAERRRQRQALLENAADQLDDVANAEAERDEWQARYETEVETTTQLRAERDQLQAALEAEQDTNQNLTVALAMAMAGISR